MKAKDMCNYHTTWGFCTLIGNYCEKVPLLTCAEAKPKEEKAK
jgi:hypothetical protein